MSAIATAAAPTLPLSFCLSSKHNSRKGVKGGFRVFAIIGDSSGFGERKNLWTTIFDIEEPRSKAPLSKSKILDVNEALQVARFDIQYCDWKARQDVLTIMLLHEKVVEVLNPLAREFKSIGTLKKDLAELQEELAIAHNQVHILEARVSTALDKLAYMETLINDKILQDTNTSESDCLPSTSSIPTNIYETMKNRQPRKALMYLVQSNHTTPI